MVWRASRGGCRRCRILRCFEEESRCNEQSSARAFADQALLVRPCAHVTKLARFRGSADWPVVDDQPWDGVVRSVYSRDGFPGSFMLALSRLSAGFPGGDDPGRIINSPCSEVGAGRTQSPKVERGTYPAGKLVLVPCDLPPKLTCERS